MTVRVGLCRTWSETTLLVFPRGGSNAGNVPTYLLTGTLSHSSIKQTINNTKIISVDTTTYNHDNDGSVLNFTTSTFRQTILVDNSTFRPTIIVDKWPASFFDGVDFSTRSEGKTLVLTFQPLLKKTKSIYMQKQRRRSAVQ